MRQAEVVAKVEELFKDAPDLSSTFLDFLPGTGMQDHDGLSALRGPGTRTNTPTGEHTRAQKRKQPAEPAAPAPSAPAKRRRKAADRDKEKERDTGRATGSRVSVFLAPHWEMINAPQRRSRPRRVASRQRFPISTLSPLHRRHVDRVTIIRTMHSLHQHHRTTRNLVPPLHYLNRWPQYPTSTRPSSSHG